MSIKVRLDRLWDRVFSFKVDDTAGEDNLRIPILLETANGDQIDKQNPLNTSNASVHVSDIDLPRVTTTGWVGDIEDLFKCPHDSAGLYNEAATSPKIIYVSFCRTIYLNSIGIGCSLSGKTFSNLKIEFIGSDETVRATYDDSANSTKYGTKLYSFTPTACVAIKFSFYTTDTVGITNITIQKESNVVARIRALKSDGAITDIGASNTGALKVAIEDEQTSKKTEIDSLGQLKTVRSVSLVGTSFSGTTKDTNFWAETVTGTGAVVQAGEVTLSTGATADSTAKYVSVRKSRKVPGAGNQFRTVITLKTAPQANNVRRIGAYDANDGLFFQVSGTTFSIGYRKGASDTLVNSGSFNGNWGATKELTASVPARLVIDITEYTVRYFLNDILLHTLMGTTESLCNTFNLPVTMENNNSGGNTTDNSFEVRFATIQRLGDIKTANKSVYLATNATSVLKYGAGTIQSIAVLDNAGTISLYDGAVVGGRVLGIIDALKVVGNIDYPAQFDNYLTVVIAGNAKATIFYE
jgi:hypothetical protein